MNKVDDGVFQFTVPMPMALRQMADGIETGHGFASMAQRAGVSFEEMRALFRGVDVPIARASLMDGGEAVEVGGRAVQLVWTPGHTEGHLCVLDSRSGALFTGDHLLARITPHVGRFNTEGCNPLHDFEDSLGLVERMGPPRALPAHEVAIENPAERCRELLEHHRVRRLQVLAEVGNRARTAEEVADRIFRGREGGMHRMLALSETEAHLEALVSEGVLEHLRSKTGVAYTLKGSAREPEQESP